LRAPWTATLFGLAIWLVAAVLLGVWFGAVAWWLVAALGIYLGYVLRQAYRIERALRSGAWPQWDATKGLWAEMFGRITNLRKKSRRRKKRYNQLLREIRESTGALADAGVLLNPEGEIVWFNRAATALLGLDRKRDRGQRIENLLRGPEFAKYLNAPTSEGVLIAGVLANTDRLMVQIIPYGQQQSLLIARDVTRQELLEKTRRDFVANASHELRSPLTVIAGYLDALQESGELPADWQSPVHEMQRQTERMTGILSDLLELSRLESARGEAGDTLVDVPALVERIVTARTRPNGPQLEIDSCAEAGLLGSEAEIYSIFDNLIGNALRFTPVDGRVTVSWLEDHGDGLFVVRDTGIGIPAEFLSRLTERFFRVDAGRSRDTGGTGLGLAIVKHALQRHGGELLVSSEVGEGAEFTCRFPARRLAHRGLICQV
jgi:two-component system phosphate regulon sensor histidine kinase PhoR